MRLTRNMMLEVLRQDYIRTAWANGLKERLVIVRHALKNALIPVLTMIGLQLPVLVGGAVLVESIFNLPGVGGNHGAGDGEARLRNRLGPQPDRRHLHSVRQPLDRHQLRVARSAHPVPVTMAVADDTGIQAAGARKRAFRTFIRRLFREKPFGAAGLIVVLLFFLIGVFANQLAPHDYADQDVPRRLEGPSAEFLLGTDQFGRDSLSRILHGARISMVVGLLASAFTVLTATVLGVISGYWRGTFDLILQRFVDAVMSFPWLFLVLTAMLLLGPSILSIAVVIGVPWGIANVRTIRSVVLSVRENAYVEAARATGASPLRILAQHVLP